MIEKIKIGNRNIVIRVKKMIVLGIQQFQDPYYQGVACTACLLHVFIDIADLHTFVPGARILFPFTFKY